jgi:type IV pilus assembly protein PilB
VIRQQVEKAQEIQAKLREKKIGDMLIESGCVSEEKVYSALAEKFRKPYIDLKTIDPSEDAKSHLPRNLILELLILPLSINNGHLVLATSRPEMTQAVDVLRSQLEYPFDLTFAAPSQLKAAIIKKYGN